LGAQVPPLQKAPGAQFASMVQPTEQAPATQGLGKQLSGTCAGQVGDAPLQVEVCMSVMPSAWQTAAAHTFPLSRPKVHVPVPGLQTPAA
jgi:hypothetical protein